MNKEWGNLKDAAGVANVDPKTIRNWIDKEIIPPKAVKEYGQRIVRINLSEVDRITNSGRISPVKHGKR